MHDADGIPILVRVINHKNFQPGPFRLGRWQLPINLAAVSWVVTSSVRIRPRPPPCFAELSK